MVTISISKRNVILRFSFRSFTNLILNYEVYHIPIKVVENHKTSGNYIFTEKYLCTSISSDD